MAKQKRYSEVERERAIASYISCGNVQQVSEETGIAESTIRGWIKRADAETGKVAEMRAKKRAEFADRAWDTIEKGVMLLDREMKTALDDIDKIDKIIDEIASIPNEDMTYKDRIDLIKRLSHMARPDMREITTAVGTMYDKAALARGESTANETFSVNIKVID